MELENNEANFLNQNRAFRYGDGLFETIIFENKKLKFWDLHLQRLKKGVEILHFEVDNLYRDLENKILEAVPDKNKNYRIRLQLWRADGGLYTPLSNKVNYHIHVQDYVKQTPTKSLKTEIATSINLTFSVLSASKTCNALPYILANIEKKERNLDEIILLSSDGFLAECSSSNLFWIKDDILFTPSLSTGCIAGVMREHIINQSKVKNINLEIGEFKPKILTSAEVVFCTNVTGIRLLIFSEINTTGHYILSQLEY